MADENNQSERIDMPIKDYEKVIRAKVLDEIKRDIETWAFKKIKLWSIVFCVVSYFGVAGYIHIIFSEAATQATKTATSAAAEASKASIEAGFAASDARSKMRNIGDKVEKFEDETQSTLDKINKKINSIDGKMNSVNTQMELGSAFIVATEEQSPQKTNAVEKLKNVMANAQYTVFVYHVDGQLEDSNRAAEFFIKNGFESTNVSSDLIEAGDRLQKGKIRIVYDGRGREIVQSIRNDLEGMFPGRVQLDGTPKKHLSKNVQVLFY